MSFLHKYAGHKWIKSLIGICIVITIFCWLGRRLYIDVQRLKDYDWHIQPFWLGSSCIFLMLWWLALSIVWSLLIRRLRVRLSLRKGFKFWALSQLGSYLPGKLWYALGRAYLCAKENIEKSTTIASVLLEAALIVIAAGFVFLLALPFMMSDHPVSLIPYLSVIPVGLLIIHPFPFGKVFNFLIRRLKGAEVEFSLSYLQMLCFMGLYLTLWLLCGLAFFLFVNSIHRVGWDKFIPITGTFAAAWIVGFLSFIAPGGLGVREGVLSVLLASYIPAPIAIVVALLSRIWFITAQLVCAAVAWRL